MFPEKLSVTDMAELKEFARAVRGDIITMTVLAASGHPGGAMSSTDLLSLIYRYAGITPLNFQKQDRNKVLVSIGHISPAIYSILSRLGFFPTEDAIAYFRLAGSEYEGHIERTVPGVEWTTGNLGQGLSAACGLAYADKLEGHSTRTFVLTGDGEHQKGQISEARRFASHYALSNLTVIIDNNDLQISGGVHRIMNVNFAAEYAADGWAVFETDGHDFQDILSALKGAERSGKPSVIVAHTVMGKGVSFMEHNNNYHGSPIKAKDYSAALSELALLNRLDFYKEKRKNFSAPSIPPVKERAAAEYRPGGRIYPKTADTDCRSAFGNAIIDIVTEEAGGNTPILVFDCDLSVSVKTNQVEVKQPKYFVQCGISEHHACSMAGAVSRTGMIPFYTGFTMFAVDEVYNQLRMNDINKSNLKVVSTHAGIDVGEDGKTHHCIDYLGLIRNIPGFKTALPSDPNQTDHIIRYIAANHGNFLVTMGRSKTPVITDEAGAEFFGKNYRYIYGSIDELRHSDSPFALLSYGAMTARAVAVWESLKSDLPISVFNTPSPLFFNAEAVKKLKRFKKIFVLEDHIPSTGLFATLCQLTVTDKITNDIVPFGVKNYAPSGSSQDLYRFLGLDPASVAEKIKKSC
jgi:transketolase